ncbi:MAG: methyltransferase domain-containing protein, partial [Bacteroidetes bacterium]|nr:methyltransferase domain-containing protein [Bacteroidota bacterium]
GRTGTSRQFISWALQTLHIQPYQHLLEIGYGDGQLTEEVARTLRIGFVAGIEPSVPSYQLAYRRNRRFIRRQLLQLHIGDTCELSYPSHYFHTIYGNNIHLSRKDIYAELLRLAALLRHKGRLVLLLTATRDNPDIKTMTLRLREACFDAGLKEVYTEQHRTLPDSYMALIAHKIL